MKARTIEKVPSLLVVLILFVCAVHYAFRFTFLPISVHSPLQSVVLDIKGKTDPHKKTKKTKVRSI